MKMDPLPKVVLVEDERLTLRVLEDLLREHGFDPVAFDRGAQAWAYYQEHPSCFVLTDWEMPGMDGVELTRRIRGHRLGGYSFILVHTARGQRDFLEEGLPAGADDYLAKPLDLEQLLLRVRVAAARAEERYQRFLDERRRDLAERKYRLLFHNEFVAMCFFEIENGAITECNQAFCDLFGYTEAELADKTIFDLSTSVGRTRRAIEELTRAGQFSASQREFKDKSGKLVQVDVSSGLVTVDDRVQGVAVLRDITEIHESNVLRRQTEALFQAAAEGSLDNFLILEAIRNPSGQIKDFQFVFFNQRAAQQFDLDPREDLGALLCERFPVNEERGFLEKYIRVVETQTPLEEEFFLGHKHAPENARIPDFEGTWWRHQIVPLKDGIAISNRNITERKRYEFMLEASEAKYKNLALYDHLTRLPNRALLIDRLEQSIAAARRENTMVGLLLVDLNDFKHVNDDFGHLVGDQFLVQIASRLQDCIRGHDTVARFGGDEFIIIQRDVRKHEEADALARRVIEQIEKPLVIEDETFHPRVSIGMSFFPADGDSVEALIRRSDNAMYRAKGLSRKKQSSGLSRGKPTSHYPKMG